MRGYTGIGVPLADLPVQVSANIAQVPSEQEQQVTTDVPAPLVTAFMALCL